MTLVPRDETNGWCGGGTPPPPTQKSVKSRQILGKENALRLTNLKVGKFCVFGEIFSKILKNRLNVADKF